MDVDKLTQYRRIVKEELQEAGVIDEFGGVNSATSSLLSKVVSEAEKQLGGENYRTLLKQELVKIGIQDYDLVERLNSEVENIFGKEKIVKKSKVKPKKKPKKKAKKGKVSDIDGLAEKVRENSGFFVYWHTCNRPDLNEDGNVNKKSWGYHRAITENFMKNKMPKTCICNGSNFNLGKIGQLFPLLLTASKPVDLLIYGPSEIEQSKKRIPVKLEDVLKTDSKEDAYFAFFSLKDNYSDVSSRMAHATSSVSIYSTKEIIEGIVDYLKNNPQDNYKLLRKIFKDFPKTKEKFLRSRLNKKRPKKELIVMQEGDINPADFRCAYHDTDFERNYISDEQRHALFEEGKQRFSYELTQEEVEEINSI